LKAFSGGFLDGATNYSDVPGAPLRGGRAALEWSGVEPVLTRLPTLGGKASILQAMEQISDQDVCGRQNPEAIKKLRSITTIDASKTSNKNTNKK
jgi:hypothetical protein